MLCVLRNSVAFLWYFYMSKIFMLSFMHAQIKCIPSKCAYFKNSCIWIAAYRFNYILLFFQKMAVDLVNNLNVIMEILVDFLKRNFYNSMKVFDIFTFITQILVLTQSLLQLKIILNILFYRVIAKIFFL